MFVHIYIIIHKQMDGYIFIHGYIYAKISMCMYIIYLSVYNLSSFFLDSVFEYPYSLQFICNLQTPPSTALPSSMLDMYRAVEALSHPTHKPLAKIQNNSVQPSSFSDHKVNQGPFCSLVSPHFFFLHFGVLCC